MPQFETQIIEVLRRTPSCQSVRFCRPEDFEYLPGQFIILSLEGMNSEIKKPLSLSSSPNESFLEVTKRLTGHEFSNTFLSLKEGGFIRFSGPYGSFTFSGERSKVVMLCGGIGITPLLSIMKYCTNAALPTDIILFYSNQRKDDIPFQGELSALQRRNQNIKIICTLTRPDSSWRDQTGRIDRDMIEEHVSDLEERTFYCSGPGKMVDSMLLVLKEMGIPDEKVKKEYFPGYD